MIAATVNVDKERGPQRMAAVAEQSFTQYVGILQREAEPELSIVLPPARTSAEPTLETTPEPSARVSGLASQSQSQVRADALNPLAEFLDNPT